MNDLDDNDLINELHDAIAKRAGRAHAPEGLTAGAQRRARRRATTRVAAAGVPVLAAAGLVTALFAGGPGGPTGGSTLAPVRPSAAAPAAHAQDTAYIVKRVSAKIAADNQSDTVIYSYGFRNGDLNSDGSLTNLSGRINDTYQYTNSTGTEYVHNVWYDQGQSVMTGTQVLVPDPNGDGKSDDTRTIVDLVKHVYGINHYPNITSSPVRPPSSLSSPAQIKQALQSGQVTQQGSATIDGTSAIALALPATQGGTTTLYVDATSYQPLRLEEVPGGSHAVLVTDWLPATSANIAQATDPVSIPTGYTQIHYP